MRPSFALLSSCCALVLASSAATAGVCDAAAGSDAPALRQRAAELYATGEHSNADACVALALVAVTKELELLAAQAQALRSFRSARQQAPTIAPQATGCVIDASGSAVCLPELDSSALTSSSPTTAEECGSEEAALSLLSTQLADSGSGGAITASKAAEDEAAASAPLDAFIMQSARRHWWGAAKKAVDVLRAQNVPPSAEARRTVTELRDGAGAVLALMRQTKMDEATISCAVMWAQGLYTVHLNVKFAGRLDAPVTVLNVDNEVVSITEGRVSFAGVGRQKPKRYVIDLELFDKIDANASSWSFGSVGTVRFTLRKATEGTWARLTASNESVKNHRVWWEKQEQVERADRKEKDDKDKAVRDAENAERARKREEEDKARQAEEQAAEEQARLERAKVREQQKPLLDAALAAVDVLATKAVSAEAAEDGGGGGGAAAATAEGGASDGAAAEGGSGSVPPPTFEAAKQALLDATNALLAHETVNQSANATAAETAEDLANILVSLRSTGFAELTIDAQAARVTQLKQFLESHVVPEEEAPPAEKAGGKKKRKKKKKKAQEAA